ncbi:class I SAM-dependent methyltransferase [Longitalea arenae]|uniref:class I SAM-dependent methyltransferase n=1 Tax=Longitalea arenae TaxID=2812558 RepID=UPI001966EA89|nr:class I SAM-dependent methyltransferase [Longitalea arenae]
MENEKKNAFEAYNIIADWFFENRYQGVMEQAHLDRLINIVGNGARVLDLGCGTGIPILKYLLSQGMQVIGVDASYRMLEIAKKNFPSIKFVLADMRQLSLGQKFDAIIAWHSLFHLPPEDQPPMFQIFKTHLNNSGLLLFTSGTEYSESWVTNDGTKLFHGSLNTSQYRSLLEENAFRILEYRENDPECGNANVWMAQLSE